MIYLTFVLSLATLVLLALELHGNRKERQSLALLIKSRDVQEFVRAETTLAMPRVDEPAPPPPGIPLDMADPDRVAAALEANDNKPTP